MSRSTVEERFWSKVDKNRPVHPRLGTKCWLWAASTCAGYGSFGVGKKTVLAHRFSWELQHGPIPEGAGYHGTVVRHRCDNKLCVNPDHLETGTQAENIRDRDERGRHGSRTKPECLARGDRNGSRTKPECLARGEKNGSAKLTAEQVRTEVKKLRSLGLTQKEVGTRLGVSPQQISNIERGRYWKHITQPQQLDLTIPFTRPIDAFLH